MSLISHLLCKKLWLACSRSKHTQFEFIVTELACTASQSPCSLYKSRCRGQSDLAGVTVWVFGFPGCCGVSSSHRPIDVGLKSLRWGGGFGKFNSRCPPTLLSRRWEIRRHAATHQSAPDSVLSLCPFWRTHDPAEPGPPWYSLGLCCSCNFLGTPHTAPAPCWEVSDCARCSCLLHSLVPPPGNSPGPLPPTSAHFKFHALSSANTSISWQPRDLRPRTANSPRLLTR